MRARLPTSTSFASRSSVAMPRCPSRKRWKPSRVRSSRSRATRSPHARARPPRPDEDAAGPVQAEQIAHEPSPVELEGGMERKAHRADLAHLLERAIAGRRIEEVAQPVLRQLLLVEVGREAQPAHQ